MPRSRRWTVFHYGPPILVVLAGIPFVAFATFRIESDSSGFVQWMPHDHAAKRDYDEFVARFGSDDYVVVTWSGCTLDDSRLDRLAAAVDEHPGVPSAHGGKRIRLFRRAYSGPQLLEEMTARPLNLSRSKAAERLSGVLLGPDAESTALIVQLSEDGRNRQRAAVACIERLARQSAGIDSDDLRMGGTVFEATSMEIEIEHTLHNYILPIFLVTFAITWWFLRSIRQVLIVILVAFYCRCLSLALVYYAGHKLSIVLSIMPVLVYVLSVSAGIHLVNYFRDALAAGDVGQAPRKTLQAGWLPCTLATVTTMIGLFSLGLSSIVPVRTFGIYSGVSMLLSLMVLLAVIPWALRIGIGRRELDRAARRTTPDGSGMQTAVPERLASFVARRHVWIALACASLVLGAACGLPRITTSVDVEHMFSRQSELIRNYQWIENRLGPLGSIEIVVGFNEESPLDPLQRLALISKIEAQVRALPDVGGTMSAATLLPEVPKPGGLRQTAKRSVFRRNLNKARPELADKGYLCLDGASEHWRITARVPALNPRKYEDLIREVRVPVEAVTAARRDADGEGITVAYTGLVPMMQAAQKQVLDDLRKSLMMAAALICPVMMGILRSFWSGLLSMIPNLFPMIVVFGTLGWIGKPIDVGIMLTASVALGIAVDDTLHFLTWFARGIRDGIGRPGAIRYAYHKCARAMAETTFICGFGLLPLVFIHFVPTREFAILLFAILLVALVGDLILLPAILAGPLGKFFLPRKLLARSR